jgi:histidinol-phosphate aminotransferase
MGLLDYYKQFEGMDQAEMSQVHRKRRDERRAKELMHVPTIDLSDTEWPDFPNSEVMNASIYVARGRINGYPDRHAERLRRKLAERHEIEPEQIVVGNGAAELLQAAAHTLLAGGGELVTPWPSYPLYPLMAARAGGKPVAVDLSGDRIEPERLLHAIGERTRALVICNPNDPTGTHLTSGELAALLERLPSELPVLLDEALVHFVDAEEEDACLRLVQRFPNLLVVRTFSKAYGLSGLRIGYAVGSAESAELLASISPVLGVNALSQAAAEYAVGIADREIAGRRSLVSDSRKRLERELAELPVEFPPSQANFIWLRAEGMNGGELARRLERERIIVAPGGPLGADDHVRIALRGPHETDRFVLALKRALTEAEEEDG